MTNRRRPTGRTLSLGAPSLALLLAACGDAPTTPDGVPVTATNRPLPVRVAAVEPVDGYDRIATYTGVVKARQTTDLGFEVGGRIVELAVDAGAEVQPGQILARLDSKRLAARKADTAARLAQAEASLAEMRAGPRAEVIAAARAEALRLEKEERLATLQLERRRKLIADRVASQEDVDIAETRLQTVQAELAGARARLLELQNGTRKEQVDAQQALVASLRAQLQRAEVDLEDCALRAPFAGTIAARRFDAGAVVDVGHPVFRLVEAGRLEAWVGVPPAVLAELRQAATTRKLDLTIAGQEVAATAPRTLPELDDRTRTTTLVFDLPPDLAGVQPGEVVRLRLARRVPTPGFALPLAALTESGRGLWSCYVLDAADATATVRRAEVQVLHVEVDRALVRGTLRAGDRVVLAGTQRIVPGMLVSVAPAGAAEDR